jgi:hypothetical protein
MRVRPAGPINLNRLESSRISAVYVNGGGILSRVFWIASADALPSGGPHVQRGVAVGSR